MNALDPATPGNRLALSMHSLDPNWFVLAPTSQVGQDTVVLARAPCRCISQTGPSMSSARTLPIANTSFFMLKAVHAHNHSVRTLSNPRNRNWRRPSTCLMSALGLSAKWARLAYAVRPGSVLRRAATSCRTTSC